MHDETFPEGSSRYEYQVAFLVEHVRHTVDLLRTSFEVIYCLDGLHNQGSLFEFVDISETRRAALRRTLLMALLLGDGSICLAASV